MLLADRPTTSRWAPPPTEANTPYQVRPILEGKNRGRHFARKTPSPGSQIALEPDLGSASDPTRTVARAGTHNATPGLLLLSRPLGPRYCNATQAIASPNDRRRAGRTDALTAARRGKEPSAPAVLSLRTTDGSSAAREAGMAAAATGVWKVSIGLILLYHARVRKRHQELGDPRLRLLLAASGGASGRPSRRQS